MAWSRRFTGKDGYATPTAIAADAGLPSFRVRVGEHPDRTAWDVALTAATAAHRPDLIVSAGFLEILGATFLSRFPGRGVNTHPALLPAFPGCTVHLVDAGVDTGPVLAQQAVEVLDGDDEESLHERIKIVERRLLVDVLAAVARHGVTWSGRKAMLG